MSRRRRSTRFRAAALPRPPRPSVGCARPLVLVLAPALKGRPVSRSQHHSTRSTFRPAPLRPPVEEAFCVYDPTTLLCATVTATTMAELRRRRDAVARRRPGGAAARRRRATWTSPARWPAGACRSSSPAGRRGRAAASTATKTTRLAILERAWDARRRVRRRRGRRRRRAAWRAVRRRGASCARIHDFDGRAGRRRGAAARTCARRAPRS